jgi:hypothetical protein
VIGIQDDESFGDAISRRGFLAFERSDHALEPLMAQLRDIRR